MAERAVPSREELEREVARLSSELAAVRAAAERSERLAGKRELQSRQDLGLILGSMPSMLIGVGRDGRINLWNDCAASAFGIPAEQAVGRYFPECGIDWDWTRILACRDQVIERQCCLRLHDIDYRRSDRRAAVLALTLVWVGASDSGFELLLFMVDTTARRQQQAQSMQSMKLEAIGQLAAGIAHEINTPMQFIGDNLAFFREFTEELFRGSPSLLERLAAGSAEPEAVARLEPAYHQGEIPKALRQSADGVERIASIVAALKEFSHPDGTDPVLIDLNRCLENAATICRNEYKMVADLKLEPSKETLTVSCFPSDLHQVFINLIINGGHAIAERIAAGGGRGTIALRTRKVAEWYEIEIADDGAGIPLDVQERIFEPFFTTKGVGKGTGQGLYISREIVHKRHGGSISFTSLPGQGTTFLVRLPLNGPPLAPRSSGTTTFRRR